MSDGPGAGEVSLAEERHRLVLDQTQVGGREGEPPVESLARLGIAPQTKKSGADGCPADDRPGIETLRLPEVLDGRLPAPEGLLGLRRSR